MSRATHARFLTRKAQQREAALDQPVTACLHCGGTLTLRMISDGLVTQMGPGSLHRSCYLENDCY